MSVIIETVIALSTFLLLVSGGDYLAIFRGKSKHTSLISPFEGWTLPEYELKSSFGSKFDDRYYFDPAPLLIGKGNTFRRLKAHGEKFPSYSSTVSQSAAENVQLLFACQKCILLHGIYEIWSEGYSVEEVASKCETSVQYQSLLEAKSVINDHNSSDKLVSINVAASILEQPWLSTEQLKTDVLSKFDYLWQNVLSNQKEENSGTSNEIEVRSRKQKLSLDEQGLSEDFASLPMERSKLPAAGTAIELRIYQDETSGYCVLCRLLAKGLAAPSNSGEGGRDPLPLTGSLRRPLSGVLNTFALKSMPHRTPTAMEPEIGFLMANLARVGPGSRVLDPFAGCCSLLLSAAFLQGMTPVEAGAIIPSRPHSHPLRDDLGDSWGASAPPKTPSSPSPTSADTDIYRACLVGVDACMGDDVSMIHSNFVAAGLGSHLASLTLRWDFAERLLQASTASTGSVIGVDGGGSGGVFEREFMFDCIVTDPPYDMAESARSVSSSEGGRTADTQAEGTVTSATTRGVGAGQNSNTAGSAKTPASSSLRVDGVLSTLLLVASQRLRLGGRLVFFAPHRDRGQDRDKKGRKDVVGTAVSQAAEVHSETEGRGLISEEEEEEGPAALAQIVASAVPAVSVSLSAANAPPLGAGGAGGGIEQKMSKRKAFKKRAKALLLHPDALQHQRSSSPSPLLSPLSFLPPLPPNLVLVECHQQVMSPTFSRWLCVIEKVEVEMDGDFIGDVTATMVIDAK